MKSALETVTYDEAGRSFAAGRLTTMTDGTGRTEYEYERRGLLRREAKMVGTALYVTGFRYDGDGNRSAIVYPSGTTVTQGFDLAGRPVSASYGSVPLVSSAEYLPFGPATQVTYGNATVKDVTFDARYRVSETMLTGSQGVLARYGYGYDPASNITQINDLVDASYSRGFGYDDLGRLTSTTSGAALWGSGSYQYDAMGNLTALAIGTTRTASFAYQGTTPKIATATENGTVRAVQYDASGNESAVGLESFVYSARNSLISAPEALYAYDGRGIRTVTEQRTTGSPRRISLYTPELSLLAETETTTAAQPSIAYEYVWFDGEPLVQVQVPTASISYYYNDHLGAPVLQTDGSGTVVWRVEREPYGERFMTRAGAARYQPLGLPGREYDGSSERQYNIFRWYRSGWGRYTQSDPLGLGGGMHLYGYADEGPISHTDPTGLSTVTGTRRRATSYPRRTQLPSLCNGQLSCTDFGRDFFRDSRVRFECRGCGTEWSLRFTAVIAYDMYLSSEGAFPGDPYHERHEQLHVDDVVNAVKYWLDQVERDLFISRAECEEAGNLTAGQLRTHVRSAAAGSQRVRR